MKYALIRELAGLGIPAAAACRVLGVSLSGYKDWVGRPASLREQRNTELVKIIREIHAESRGSHGSRRVHAELVAGRGESVNHKRVERLMRQAGIQGIHRRRGRHNLVNAATAEDLVQRSFTADAPDRLWCTDITEHPASDGKLYCAAVLDCFSRRIIGHSIDVRQNTELVVNAMAAAVARRDPVTGATVLHSDHGTQFTSFVFGKRLRDAGLLGSMGTIGDCCDNAMMESFWERYRSSSSIPRNGQQGLGWRWRCLNGSSAGITHSEGIPVSECSARSPTRTNTTPSRLPPADPSHPRWPCYGGNLSVNGCGSNSVTALIKP
ncbi:IS3 family transposase [Actinomadura oligospora]|uniref:IS3 family transposase n=1 Tax=Actinomadura oligospora TaxID=111804 RepID=UPI003CCB7E57